VETAAFALSGLLVGVAVAVRKNAAPAPWAAWSLLLAALGLVAGVLLVVLR
jgi:hypothetical protein